MTQLPPITLQPGDSITISVAAVVNTPPTTQTSPYDPKSPWNRPIGTAALDPKSATFITAISNNGLPLTSDPDQYAIPVYLFSPTTPLATVRFSGYYSTYDAGDNSRVGHGTGSTQQIPIPASVVPSAGSDAQCELVDLASGTHYGFWQLVKNADGTWNATNGYRYHTGPGNFGRFADGAAGRGAGTPYLAGLVRKWEIDQGHIDHALAFAYKSPAKEFRYPASKSDGSGVTGTDLPEGTRIQLDPYKIDADFTAWGLSPEAKVIAKALQLYGMYCIDNSGSSKIYLEDRLTAGWPASINRDLVSKIPWSAFRVVAAPPVAT